MVKISEMLDTAPLLCYNSLVILERPTGGESHMCQKKKAFVENRDQYRGVFSFCSIGVLLAASHLFGIVFTVIFCCCRFIGVATGS